MVLIPVVLAKLWSVMPKLFVWPPVRSIAQVLERLSMLMLVGGVLFEIATGVLNIQYDYLYGFSFFAAHYFGAWVFIAGFVIHISLKIPRMVEGLRSRSLREVLRTNTADTKPEPAGSHGLVAGDPAPATVSRRGALALVGGGALLTALVTVGQTIGGIARHLPLMLPTGDTTGKGPNDFRINKTAEGVALDPATTGASWRLTLRGGPVPVVLDRAMLSAMPQHSARLPIACVQGWSTVQDLERSSAIRSGRFGRSAGAALGGRRVVGAQGKIQSRNAGTPPDQRSRTHCWRCGSMAPTCLSITATRRASSSPRSTVCTTPNGSNPSTSRGIEPVEMSQILTSFRKAYGCHSRCICC